MMSRQTVLEQPDNMTYYAVMAAYKSMRKTIAEEASRVGLTPPQFRLLRTIAKNGAMSSNRISQEMLVTPPNVTGVVDRLEAKGLVNRIADPQDRRTTMIELTAEGKYLQETVSKAYNAFMKQVLSEFTVSEKTALRRLLTKLDKVILQKSKFKKSND